MNEWWCRLGSSGLSGSRGSSGWRQALGAVLAALLLSGGAAGVRAGNVGTCVGRFPNPVTDICWSCMLPISIGAARLVSNGQEDIDNPASPLCSCGMHPIIGLSIGFWEPARVVEVVRKPFCLPSLGGVDLDPGIAAPEAARVTHAEGSGDGGSFYQAHYYLNPVLTWMQVITDFICLEKKGYDLAYLTEVDPLWNDDELTLIIHPDAVLFANPIAVAACAADCVAASTGFGLNSMFWCDGCQGSIFPLDGWVPFHMGGVRTSELITMRLMAKLHREMIAWGFHGDRGLCGPYVEPMMNKTAYKLQLTHPIAATAKTDGKCCQPFGRTTVIWGAGMEFPVRGEDFAYLLFRKRNCCVGF